jgi:hypothetical protein
MRSENGASKFEETQVGAWSMSVTSLPQRWKA